MPNESRCNINAILDDATFPVVFQNMRVDVPILSVRKYVKGGWSFSFEEKGGTMTNLATGKTFKFIEAEGAYWIKIKVQNPNDNKVAWPIPPVFSRPGSN